MGFTSFILGSWLLATLLGGTLHLLGRRHGRSGWRAAGVAIMSIPAWMVLLTTVDDMVRTFCEQGNVAAILPPRPASAPSAESFLSQAVNNLLRNVGYPAVGLLLWLHGRQKDGPLGTTWTEKLAELVPMGHGAVVSLRVGVALFPILAIANLILVPILGLQLIASDASPVFGNLDAPAALALAFSAGLGEELVYRGVMQQGLKHALRPIIPNRATVVGLAIALQSIPFAYAHAGYGDFQLLFFNVAFAVVAGIAVETLGLGAAVALHALIDLYAFFLQVPSPDPLFVAAIAVVTAGVLAAAVFETQQLVRRRRIAT
ncbi:MAG: CPBP family intramembrane glutamic endopeptidase [Candidatus Thermoplasmatota archaeon]